MPAPQTGDAATPFDDEDPGDREAAPGDELAPDDGWLDGTPGKSSMPRDTAAGDELQA